MTRTYPINLVLSGRRAVVVGGGPIAERKVKGLLAAGARVTVISPQVTAGIRRAGARPARTRTKDGVRWERRMYQAGDLRGAFVAIAATSDERVNRAVYREAERRGILVNVVDVPPLCNFYAPAIVRWGGITVSVSTGGGAPALAKKIRQDLQKMGEPYSAMLRWTASVRPRIMRAVPTERERKRVFTRLVRAKTRAEFDRLVRQALKNGSAR